MLLGEIEVPKKKVDNPLHPDIIRHPRPEPESRHQKPDFRLQIQRLSPECTEIMEKLAKQLRTWMALAMVW
jgi:hypothetical protein